MSKKQNLLQNIMLWIIIYYTKFAKLYFYMTKITNIYFLIKLYTVNVN